MLSTGKDDSMELLVQKLDQQKFCVETVLYREHFQNRSNALKNNHITKTCETVVVVFSVLGDH